MSRRSELEKELELAQKQLDELPADAPQEIKNSLREQYDNISFELNNLYDDDMDDDE